MDNRKRKARLCFLLVSSILTGVWPSYSYAQTTKSSKGTAVKTEASASASASVIDDIRSEIHDYNLDKAKELIERVETANRRNKKKNPLPDGLDALKEEMSKLSEMLDRVESIEIIDSITVAKRDAYKQIPLSPAAGHYLSPSVLPDVFPRNDATSVYATEDYSLIMWGARNADGKMRIYQSDRLSDGTYATPVEIEGEFGDADISYPYLSSDGVTLYYASKNTDGLGGYDIFMTRSQDGRYLLPQNIGMPYNSLSDDYMLVIDDAKNVGWWMTERFSKPDMVTIYTFIPRELRKNYSPDTPNLPNLAKVKNYKDSWQKDKDYSDLIALARQIPSDEQPSSAIFEIYIPGMGIYHNYSDFKSRQAMELMKEYQSLTDRYKTVKNDLSQLRKSYSSSDQVAAAAILKGENDLQMMETELNKLRNEIVLTEQSND